MCLVIYTQTLQKPAYIKGGAEFWYNKLLLQGVRGEVIGNGNIEQANAE